jgi:SAM-dependent methyltransferase
MPTLAKRLQAAAPSSRRLRDDGDLHKMVKPLAALGSAGGKIRVEDALPKHTFLSKSRAEVTMSERDYILGTDDAEIERLQLQHRVWRPRMLDAWRRAGITQGQTIIDVGSGPGYASIDLAEIVGPSGRVLAVERSSRFLSALRQAVVLRTIPNITIVEADITESEIGQGLADASWCRWVFSWLTKPELAVANIACALRPSAIALFHEYMHYRSWSLAPRSQDFDDFVSAVMESVARTGAEMDIGLRLPALLENSEFEILSLTPIVDLVDPENYVWHWPAAFVRGYSAKLVAEGLLTHGQAQAAAMALRVAETRGSRMATPTVLEIIARRR